MLFIKNRNRSEACANMLSFVSRYFHGNIRAQLGRIITAKMWNSKEKKLQAMYSDNEPNKFQDLLNLFNEAELLEKELEIESSAYFQPSVNELRYAGRHLLS